MCERPSEPQQESFTVETCTVALRADVKRWMGLRFAGMAPPGCRSFTAFQLSDCFVATSVKIEQVELSNYKREEAAESFFHAELL